MSQLVDQRVKKYYEYYSEIVRMFVPFDECLD